MHIFLPVLFFFFILIFFFRFCFFVLKESRALLCFQLTCFSRNTLCLYRPPGIGVVSFEHCKEMVWFGFFCFSFFFLLLIISLFIFIFIFCFSSLFSAMVEAEWAGLGWGWGDLSSPVLQEHQDCREGESCSGEAHSEPGLLPAPPCGVWLGWEGWEGDN